MFCHRGHLLRLRTWPGGIKSFPQTWLIFFTSSCDEISGSVKYSIIRCHLFSAATCHFCPAAETSPELRVVICVSAYRKLVTHEVLTGGKHRRGSQFSFCVCFKCTMKAASTLHDRLFHRLLLSPMHFFDTTPLGRILTRFSRDMDEGEDGVFNHCRDLVQLLWPKRKHHL